MLVRKSESGRGSTPVHPENLATKDNDMDITKHFSFEGKALRTFADKNGEPWFCAADVCEVLGYANSRQAVQKSCRDKGVSSRDTLTDGGTQALTFISEGNLYRLIIKSRKPEAERFETWVMEEVLPSIRKDGGYISSSATTEQMTALKQRLQASIDETAPSPTPWTIRSSGATPWTLRSAKNVLKT